MNAICIRAGKARLDLLLFQETVAREGSFKGYKLMTSVSIPVFDKRDHSVSEAIPVTRVSNGYAEVQV